MIEVKNLNAGYGKRSALWNIDFSIPLPAFVGIIGPNGGGKSTLLKSILGELTPLTGSIRLFGKPIAEMKNRLAYVPQINSVDWNFPIRVMDVVLMGRFRPNSWGPFYSKSDREKAEFYLNAVGMLAFSKQQIGELSGGQRQRVFLARALAREADVLLLDEPLAGVDAGSGERILSLLSEYQKQGRSIVMVHHDLLTASTLFDHLVLLQTRLVAAGPIKEVFTLTNLQTAYGTDVSILSEMIHKLGQTPANLSDHP
ncbi:MAG: metal ABC transporter ATP-binding protein [Bacteroidetes bacterium]|nr:metal ABC transporter ATP-binding protein [Bacteroidota bacterium]